MNKSVFVTSSVFLFASLLTGCGGSSPSSTNDGGTSANNPTSQQPVQITFARGKDVTGATQKLVDAFQKAHPEIKVNLREMPADTGQSHDQYVTMFNAGSSDI